MAALGGGVAAEFSELLAIIDGALAAPRLDTTWVGVTEALLRFCRAHQPSAEAWAQVPPELPGSVRDAVMAVTDAGLRRVNVESHYPSRPELECLRDVLADQFDSDLVHEAGFTAALIARGLAGAIDAVHGEGFMRHFRDTAPQLEVKPNEAFPVSAHDPTALLGAGRKPNSRPTSLPSLSFDNTPHLALGSDQTPTYPLVIDFSLFDRLEALGAGSDLRLLVAQPNLSLGEFGINGTPGTARNHGPVDDTAQLTHLKTLLEHAVDQGADAVLIPEYCVNESIRQPLSEHLDTVAHDRAMIVVAGTSEVPDGDDKVHNEAWVSVPGTVSRGTQKIFPAHLGDRVEGIAPGTHVSVYPSKHISFSVLICRDAMSANLQSALAAVGVNLLLVPSFSDRTGTIHNSAAGLASRSQAFVAVGCAPASWSKTPVAGVRAGHNRKEASFIGPYEAEPAQLLVPDAATCGSVQGRGAWLFSSATRTVTWCQLP